MNRPSGTEDLSVRTPWITQALVALTLGGSRREVILGDLEEALARRIANGVSLRTARRLYRREALASIWKVYSSGAAFRSDPEEAHLVSVTAGAKSGPRSGAAAARIWKDFRFSSIALARRPGLTSLVTIALALGIGASTMVFSVVEATLLRELPVEDPQSLVMVWNRQVSDVGSSNLLSAPDYVDLRERTNTLDSVAAFGEIVVAPVVGTEQPSFARQVPVTENFFAMLGVEAQLGRLFDEVDGAEPVEGAPLPDFYPLVISHDYWQRMFDGSEDVVGRSIRTFTSNFQIVGVLPPEFRLLFPAAADVGEDLGASIDLWTCFSFRMSQSSRTYRSFRVLARTGRGSSLADVRADLDNISGQLRAEVEELDASGFALGAESFVAESGAHIRPLLWMLGFAVVCVLLVACTNVAGLLIARTSERARELSVRSALGAEAWRLARLSLSESLLLAGAGGALGVALAWVGMRLLALARPAGLPQADDLSLNWQVLGFAIVIVVICAMLAGSIPAIRAMRHGLSGRLNTRSSTANRRQRRLREGMVALQIALTVVLLVATGLLLRSFANLQSTPLGFDPERVLAIDISTVAGGADRSLTDRSLAASRWVERRQGLEHSLAEALSALPGVESAGAVFPVPLNGIYSRTCDYSLGAEGKPDVAGVAYFRNVWPGYFDSMKIPLLAGRDLHTSDDVPGLATWLLDPEQERTDRAVVVVDAQMAARLWPDQPAVGKTLRYTTSGTVFHDAEVVGVVPFVAQGGRVDGRGTIYIPRSYYRSQELTLTVRVQDDSPSTRRALVDTVHAAFPESPALIRSLDGYVERSTASNRFVLSLLGAFAATAVLLAGIGIYGALALSVRQRVNEIGIHLAMGAAPQRVFAGVIRNSLVLAAIGIGSGLALALLTSGLLSGYLHEVKGADPWAVGGSVLIQVAVTLLACWIPARRASRVQPMEALRAE